MASLFVERRHAHHHILAVLVLAVMVVLLSMMRTHRPSETFDPFASPAQRQ
jgi:hypothetical protein